MFHRPKSGLQLHPIISSQNGAAPPEGSYEFPTPEPMLENSTQSEPLSQPTDTKETETMTNTYTNPQYSGNNDTQNDAQNSVSTASHAPAFTPATTSRPGMAQAMVRSPYSYNQGYMSPSPSETPAVSTGRKLVLGEGITMSGEIEACDHLVVEGTVEATLKGASVLEVAQSGMFFGAVEINEATIAGRFEGDLVVNGRLTIRSTGTVMGTISYKELAVEAGATIDGQINPMSVNRVATTDKKSSVSKSPSHNTAHQQQAGKSSETGSELPFATKKSVAA